MTRSLRLTVLLAAALALVAVAYLLGADRDAGASSEAEEQAAESGSRPRANLQAPPPDEAPVMEASEAPPERVAAVEPEARTAVPSPAAFRGRLLDAATDEPVGYVTLHPAMRGWSRSAGWSQEGDDDAPAAPAPALPAEVDADGRFDLGAPLPAEIRELSVRNPVQNTHVRNLSREEFVPDRVEGHIARLRIGPTFRVEAHGVDGFEPEAWEARLVERDATRRDHAGSWIRLHPTPAAPFLRYDNPWEPNEEGSRFRVELRRRDGTRLGASAWFPSRCVGIHPDVIPVVCDRMLARVTGRVIDTAGRPKSHVRVTAVPLGASLGEDPPIGGADDTTDKEGRFTLSGLDLGAVQVTARPRRGERPATLRALLDAEQVELGDLVVPENLNGGYIEGLLKSRAGLPLDRTEYVRLRALDGSGTELFDHTSPVGDALKFEFNEVPAGRIELYVVPQGGYRWDPPSVVLEEPREDLVFERQDDGGHDLYVFLAEDAAGAPVSVRGVFTPDPGSPQPIVPAGTAALARVPSGGEFRWAACTPGFRPVAGRSGAFGPPEQVPLEALSEPEVVRARVLRLQLERGYGARLRFRDFGGGFLHDDDRGVVHALEADEIEGVRVFADGALVGRSTDGELLLSLETEPERIEVQAAGWRLVETDDFQSGRLSGSDVVVWMVRE